MEQTVAKSPVMLYTEQTPNPETLKFVTNKMLYRGTADFKDAESAEDWSPLATSLFTLPYVKGVYISSNFVTITKEFTYTWTDIMLPLKEFIKAHIADGKGVINDGYEAVQKEQQAKVLEAMGYNGNEAEIALKIRELIDAHVKPAVEMDGGNIEFKSFDNGVVTVILQGACSGCPSSTVTLKSGIEGMLKRMVPEVMEVVAEMD